MILDLKINKKVSISYKYQYNKKGFTCHRRVKIDSIFTQADRLK